MPVKVPGLCCAGQPDTKRTQSDRFSPMQTYFFRPVFLIWAVVLLTPQALSRLAALWLEAGRPAAAVEALEALEGLKAKLSRAETGQLAARLRAARTSAAATPRPDHYRLLGLQRDAPAEEVRGKQSRRVCRRDTLHV